MDYQEALIQKLYKNLNENKNIALELKNSHQSLVSSIIKYVNLVKDDISSEFDVLDSWGELLNNTLYYSQVKSMIGAETDADILMKSVEKTRRIK